MMKLDGEMSITQNLFDVVTRLFPVEQYEKILEIGSGVGTAHWVAAGYDVTAVEHDAQWVGSCAGAVYHHAPLVDAFYTKEVVRPLLYNNHDIWIIDGPPGIISDRTKIIELFNTIQDVTFPKVIVVDDCQAQRNERDGLTIAEYLWNRFRGCPMFEVHNRAFGGPPHVARIILP